jgi:hypothetical protein
MSLNFLPLLLKLQTNKLECLSLESFKSLMFISKAGSYQGGELFKCSDLGLAPGLTLEHYRLPRQTGYKHSSLFARGLMNQDKKIIS